MSMLICPRKGICEAIVVSWVNKDIMIEHLKQILAVAEEGCRAVVVMDGGGWHTEEIANDFKCQCNQTFALFSRAKPYRTSMALVAATLFS
ncbi:hypothetical protein P3576_20355, partial [Vibrio parahaemolyticus]|nr:hypothetical protein [Vibrio parahaemolyticus]